MKTRMIAAALISSVLVGLAAPQAMARDGWQDFRERMQQQRGWERQRDSDRLRERGSKRGAERQRQRDAEKYNYWKERDLEYKMGTPPPRR